MTQNEHDGRAFYSRRTTTVVAPNLIETQNSRRLYSDSRFANTLGSSRSQSIFGP